MTPLALSSILLRANVLVLQQLLLMLLPTGPSLSSPIPISAPSSVCMQKVMQTPSLLSSSTPQFRHQFFHLRDSWEALWWTSSATSPGLGCTSNTGLGTGLLVFGSILSENISHLSVYQYNLLIFCSGVASGAQCRCALCWVEGDLALVCPCLLPFLGLGLLWLVSLPMLPCTLLLYAPFSSRLQAFSDCCSRPCFILQFLQPHSQLRLPNQAAADNIIYSSSPMTIL